MNVRPYEPHPAQRAFHRSRALRKNICAGRRGGKSEAGGTEFIRLSVLDEANPELVNWGERQYWCVASTEDLTGLQRRKLEAAAQRYNIPLVKHEGDGLTVPGWRLWFRFRTAGNVNQLIADDVWGIWIDEAAKCRPNAWGYLEPGLTATSGWVISSTTPEGMNWYYDEFWRRGDPADASYDPRYSNHHFTSAQNPYLAWICPACLKSYRAWSPAWEARECPADGQPLIHEAAFKKGRLPRRIYEREYEASFMAFEGQVWEGLRPETHWGKAPKHMRRLIGCQDWNFALPGVYVVLGEDKTQRVWILEDHHEARLPVWDEAARCWVKSIQDINGAWTMSAQAPLGRVWADPSNPENIELERRKGLPVKPGRNSVSAGLQCVETFFHDVPGEGPRLMFDVGPNGRPRAWKTWLQCLSYRFQPGSEEPVKVNDHACDAVRYGIYSTYGLPKGRGGMQPGRVAL